jgi:hypothetical protein
MKYNSYILGEPDDQPQLRVDYIFLRIGYISRFICIVRLILVHNIQKSGFIKFRCHFEGTGLIVHDTRVALSGHDR